VSAADDRLTGRIKRYLAALVFGGGPSQGENLTWVDPDSHQKLVRRWSDKCREVVR
jgi:hypothetical protein